MPMMFDAAKAMPPAGNLNMDKPDPYLYDPQLEEVSRREMHMEEQFQAYLGTLLQGKSYTPPPAVSTEGGIWARAVRAFELAGDPDSRDLLEQQEQRSKLLFDITESLRKQGLTEEASALSTSTAGRSAVLQGLLESDKLAAADKDAVGRAMAAEGVSEAVLKVRQSGRLWNTPANLFQPVTTPWDGVAKAAYEKAPAVQAQMAQAARVAEAQAAMKPVHAPHPHLFQKDPAVESLNTFRGGMAERFQFTPRHARQLFMWGLVVPGALGYTLYHTLHRWKLAGVSHGESTLRGVPT